MHTFKSNEVSEVTLLSLEEAKALPKEFLDCGYWWWLRSPGYNTKFAASVSTDGSANEYGSNISDGSGVRPAFQLSNLKSSNLKIGDVIEVAGTEAIVISDDTALAKELVGYTAFHRDWEADNANDYETSDVKKWLEDWWQKQVEHESKLKDMQTFKSTDVSEVTLPSVKETKALPEEILACGRFWWLRSPGNRVFYAAAVTGDGSVSKPGGIVYDKNGAVRPAFRIPILKSFNLQIGDIIEVAGTKAIVISDDMALAKKPVGRTAFHINWKEKKANDYEKSDIKKWLAKWWQEQVEHESK